MNYLLVAIQFLTKIPVPIRLKERDFLPESMAMTMAFFPLVGFVLGVLLVIFDSLTFIFTPFLQGVLLLSFYTLLTGGLHLDGYIDTLDALLPSVSRERRMAIMQDSQIGAFGATGLFLLLLLKLALFLELTGPIRLLALLTFPVLSRWSMVLAALLFPGGKEEGFGYLFTLHLNRKKFLLSTLFALPAIFVHGLKGLGIFPFLFLMTILIGRWILSKIKGVTGDSFGFINEINEISLLLLLLFL